MATILGFSPAPVPSTVNANTLSFWGTQVALAVNFLLGKSVAGLTLVAIPAPATPIANQFIIFMDAADNKLKALGPSGTLTVLANP